jgi:hypothetical protein
LRSFVLAGGSVELKYGDLLVVVCGGDVDVKQILFNCLVIARGAVRCRQGIGVKNSVVLVGGDVFLEDEAWVRDSKIRAAGRIVVGKKASLKGTKVKERDSKALAGIRFFETAQAGITVSQAKTGLCVQSIARDKPFSKAALQVGDMVLAYDGAAVATTESFRTRLRRSVAQDRAAILNVRRADKTIELQIPLGTRPPPSPAPVTRIK